jgi:hypothetical protein
MQEHRRLTFSGFSKKQDVDPNYWSDCLIFLNFHGKMQMNSRFPAGEVKTGPRSNLVHECNQVLVVTTVTVLGCWIQYPCICEANS